MRCQWQQQLVLLLYKCASHATGDHKHALPCPALCTAARAAAFVAALFVQVTYLQLGASAITGAWGPPALTADALSIAAQLRTEVQPLLAAAAAGEYSLADLRAACRILADPDAPRGIAAADEGERPHEDW